MRPRSRAGRGFPPLQTWEGGGPSPGKWAPSFSNHKLGPFLSLFNNLPRPRGLRWGGLGVLTAQTLVTSSYRMGSLGAALVGGCWGEEGNLGCGSFPEPSGRVGPGVASTDPGGTAMKQGLGLPACLWWALGPGLLGGPCTAPQATWETWDWWG